MAAIILPHRWNRQPTAPCGVNKHSELARGLTHLISGAGWSAVPEYPVRVTGAAHTIKPIRGGLGFVHQALGSGFYCDADAAQINAARSWTMAIVGEIPADVSSTATFAYHSTVAANTGSWDRTIQAGYSGGYFYTSGFLYSGATYSVNGTIPLDFNAGTAAFTYVLTAGNGFLKGFTNGRADGSTAIPGNGFTGYGPCYLNFAHLGGVHRLLSLAKIDGLAWDEARALEFHRNPWQLFAPLRRRLYIPSAAAGVTFEQEGFRWRYDDGDEDGATFSAAQDEPSAASIGITKRLRVLVDVTGNPGSPAAEQFQLQYRRTGSPTEDWKKVN